jgi:hypothetical protein
MAWPERRYAGTNIRNSGPHTIPAPFKSGTNHKRKETLRNLQSRTWRRNTFHSFSEIGLPIPFTSFSVPPIGSHLRRIENEMYCVWIHACLSFSYESTPTRWHKEWNDRVWECDSENEKAWIQSLPLPQLSFHYYAGSKKQWRSNAGIMKRWGRERRLCDWLCPINECAGLDA